MKHKAALTIGKPSYSSDKQKIKISVKDSDAVINFMDIEIDLDKFTECLTGLAQVECDMKIRGLENVGKKRETMNIVFELPKPRYAMGRSEIEKSAKDATPDGWTCNLHMRSQDSFFTKDGKNYGRTQAYRWANKGENDGRD